MENKTAKRSLMGRFIPALLFLTLLLSVIYLGIKVNNLEDNSTYQPPVVDSIDGHGFSIHISKSQTVYVPVYSHIYAYGGKTQLLETTLSIRNSDPNNSITLLSARYYDTGGNKLQNYLDGQLTLKPLQSTEILIEKQDTRGGAGANFIVEWAAKTPVYEPVIEAIMIGSEKSGISFKSIGRPLTKRIE